MSLDSDPMPRNVIGHVAVSFFLVVAAAGCGGSDGPEDALNAYVKAINDKDDAAVKKLTCESSYSDHGNSLAEPFANSQYDIDEVDPRLRQVHYTAEAGEVGDETDTEATGMLTIRVEGVPDDLSPDARQVLDNGIAPFPLGIEGQDHKVKLVKKDDTWLVCSMRS
jgi:hypothetical protein